ncbi:MAG TPA: hypothetical protein DCL35_01890 [Candidatus Omnitrophica bacterium]|nr:hypothetical protein [Candidatus Omnitrophota bacterium]
MKKILGKLNALARFIMNLAIRSFLDIFYFVVLCPVCLPIRVFCDLLGIKGRMPPHWTPRKKIQDAWHFLHHQ